MKELFKIHFTKKVLLTYIYGAFASRFLGFLVSLWAVNLVGHFFEFPSFKNLWGLHSHKALVSKETFETLKWVAQVGIGFFVFEIFHKTLFSKATEYAPKYYKKGLSYMEEKRITEKARNLKITTINLVKEKVSVGKDKMRELYNKEGKPSN